MAHIRPFAALRYSRQRDFNLSDLIAPPFDVLDAASKAALQAKHPNNIVTVDLPHLPAKTVGPDSAYGAAAQTLRAWRTAGILQRDRRPAFYPYSQSFTHAGRVVHRRGFFALVRLSPFGEGQVIPHERTYKEAIVDRLKLMRATETQLSPIFGLFSDPRRQATSALFNPLGRPEVTALLDGVQNDLWTVTDTEVENQVIDQLAGQPIYIADGHHRYTTALEYRDLAVAANGGKPLPPSHPANYCMFVLVALQDDGLIILPTHRLIGGLQSFNIDTVQRKAAGKADVRPAPASVDQMRDYIEDVLPKQPPHTIGLFDSASKKLYELRVKDPDILRELEPDHSGPWRRLDVAVAQRYWIDEVLQPLFAGGKEVTKGYVADPAAVATQTDGKTFQIALLLQPTPLHALEELGKTGEVMPQKSTYFAPKLATGLIMNPLE